MVRRRRRTFLMRDADETIISKQDVFNITTFYFGSQSEGTTTPGLNSDIDSLVCFNDVNIMSSWTEWEVGGINFLMVKEETCSPQHYLLQEIRPDSPEPVINSSHMFSVVDRNGRVLYTNLDSRFITKLISEKKIGPSSSVNKMFDIVLAYRSRSFHQNVSVGLNDQGPATGRPQAC
ncbi:hypothetical protein MAR_001896 [Mya arenaria]|uniref:Uncharacterized protein n=1 Tax=Mya arenaria TaxID=6604 RepID=A0ABY7FD32_MYAAR|nr:hypothetical protein MAR_001896 [Mya arenaria]